MIPRHNTRVEPAIIVSWNEVLEFRLGGSTDRYGVIIRGEDERSEREGVGGVDRGKSDDHLIDGLHQPCLSRTGHFRMSNVPCSKGMMAMTWTFKMASNGRFTGYVHSIPSRYAREREREVKVKVKVVE